MCSVMHQKMLIALTDAERGPRIPGIIAQGLASQPKLTARLGSRYGGTTVLYYTCVNLLERTDLISQAVLSSYDNHFHRCTWSTKVIAIGSDCLVMVDRYIYMNPWLSHEPTHADRLADSTRVAEAYHWNSQIRACLCAIR